MLRQNAAPFISALHFLYYVRVVQLVEHSTDNRVVGGSNPPVNTKCSISLVVKRVLAKD